MELGIYIHIPFCVKKCIYCDFISYTDIFQFQEKYIEKLLEEIEENKEILRNNNITTIYIGGGTPSSIKPELIEKVLDKIYQVANIKNSGKIEITMEINPGTINECYPQLYKKCGINRISIGLQTTNNKLLKQIGRIHTYEQFLNTYRLIKSCSINNINVDLMLGIPNQSILDLKDSLEKVIELNPNHISVYSLIVEENTKMKELVDDGEFELPKEEDERNQYSYTKNFLELNGYIHYEISNFAKKGFESIHNTNCWKQKQYIGFGVSAHSYIDGCRYSNTDDWKKYIDIKIGKFKDFRIIHEIQNKEDMKNEYMILGLRMIEGISIQEFKEKFGENPIYVYRKQLEKLANQGLVEIDLDRIKLTRKGLDFANIAMEEFI